MPAAITRPIPPASTPVRNGWTRRRFVQHLALALATLPNRGTASPPSLDTGILDTHTHFYDPTRPEGLPWPPKDDTRLYRRVLPADYQSLPQPRPVTSTVVVEASPWVEDNQWILNLAASNPFIVGFVGNLPLGDPSFPKLLQRFARNPIFRGIRIGPDLLRNALENPTTLAHLRRIATRNLSVDLLITTEQLHAASQLATKLPSLRLIIDHVANLRIDGGPPPEPWHNGMLDLARNRNVYCKLSGLVEGTGRDHQDAPSTAAFYRPVIETVARAFGPKRLLYGSNWPVSERFAPCHTVLQIAMDSLRTQGPEFIRHGLRDNAIHVYKPVHRS